MRSNLAVLSLFAVAIIATAAYAAPDKVAVPFEPLGASTITGSATLDPIASQGEVMIHASFRGLEPNTEYVLVVYDVSTSCGDGTSSITVIQFESNPAGNATWNRKVNAQISAIESLGVRLQDTNALVACGTVPL